MWSHSPRSKLRVVKPKKRQPVDIESDIDVQVAAIIATDNVARIMYNRDNLDRRIGRAFFIGVIIATILMMVGLHCLPNDWTFGG